MNNPFRRAPMAMRGMVLTVAGLVLALHGLAQAAGDIRIGGTGNALGAMRQIGEAFAKQNPDIRVQVLPSLGTSGAIKAVQKGALDIGLSARPLSDEEVRAGGSATEYARTPLVFAVSVKTRATELSLDQVADIYTGKLASWPDGSQIRPVLRQAGDDNTRQVRKMSAVLDKALSVAEQRPGMPFATNDQEAADMLQGIPGAFGVTTLGLIKSEDRPLRALTLNGVEPSPAHGASGKYPHAKRLYYVTRPDPSADVKRFIAFLGSQAGRDLLARTGHWVP